MLVESSIAASREAVEESGIDPQKIAAIGFSTQRTCMLPLDEHGELVRPMISWQDNRSGEEAEHVAEVLGRETFHRITCLSLGAIWIVNKILWMRKHEPELWDRVAKVTQLQDYFLKAYGVDDYFVDRSCAGLFGCWDLYQGQWSETICNQFNIDTDLLPKPISSGTPVGGLSKDVAEKTGFVAGTPLCVGAGDQNAAAVGAGVVEPGMMSVSLGTGGLAAAFVDGPIENLDPEGMLTGHAIPGTYMLEGYQAAGASSLRWFRDEISRCWFRQGENLPPVCSYAAAENIDVYEILDHIAATAPPGSKGLVVNPYFASACTPRWNADARATITGMTFAHDRACLVRAFMEGITLDVKDMVNSMSRCGVPIEQIRILGGPTKCELWNQIQADIYGRPVATLKTLDAAPLGAAICAAVGAGVFGDIREGVARMASTDSQYDPIPENVKIYEELYEVFCDIYEGMNPTVYQRLAEIQQRY
jgi:xylulokinase